MAKTDELNKIIEELKKRVEKIERKDIPPHILEKRAQKERRIHPRFEFDIIEEELVQRLEEIENRLAEVEQRLAHIEVKEEIE